MTSAKDLKVAQAEFEKIDLVHVATSSKKGRPHSATLLFVPDKNFSFYFITKNNTTKTKNLLENPWMSASIGSEPPMSFQLFGRATRVTAKDESQKVMERWAKRASRLEKIWPPIFRINKEGYAIYRFKPTKVTAIDMRSQNVAGGTSLFLRLI